MSNGCCDCLLRESLRECTQKVCKLQFFKSECLTRTRMFVVHYNNPKFILSLQNQNGYKKLTLLFLIRLFGDHEAIL